MRVILALTRPHSRSLFTVITRRPVYRSLASIRNTMSAAALHPVQSTSDPTPPAPVGAPKQEKKKAEGKGDAVKYPLEVRALHRSMSANPDGRVH